MQVFGPKLPEGEITALSALQVRAAIKLPYLSRALFLFCPDLCLWSAFSFSQPQAHSTTQDMVYLNSHFFKHGGFHPF